MSHLLIFWLPMFRIIDPQFLIQYNYLVESIFGILEGLPQNLETLILRVC